MIDFETFSKIRQLFDQKHLKVSQIAAELGLHEATVAKWVQIHKYCPRQSAKRSSKLDPFKGQILAWLERHPYTGQQIFQQLRQKGYRGGYSILKDFGRQVRPVRKPAFLTLHFAPGECAQVDWGCAGSIIVGSTRRRLSFFVMVLCYSRLMYLEFTLAESMEQFLTCHQHAFEFLGSVPAKVMIDNLKTGVLRHPWGEKAQFNPRYVDFAGHYGFEPVACAVGKANQKGRVENGVGYVKKNFLGGLEIPSFAAINPGAQQWLNQTANVRLHGETHRKPIDLFAEEKSALKPLPVLPYDCSAIKSVSATNRCRVHFDGNRYSIPYLYASQKLTAKIYPDRLSIYHHEKLIAIHQRCYDRRQDIRNPDHEKELLAQRQKARQQTLLLAFLSLSPQAELYCRKLDERRLNAPHHIQKIVALSEIYGPDKLTRAIADAILYEAYGCEYIANILEQRERIHTTPTALHLTRRQDLLDLEIPAADLTPYEPRPKP